MRGSCAKTLIQFCRGLFEREWTLRQIGNDGKGQILFSDSHNEISEPYQLLNGHVGYDFGNWSVKVWGRNIIDAHYATKGFYFGLEPI